MPPRSTVEPCVGGNLETTDPKRSIRSFKPHVHLNDCLSGHPVLISQLILCELSLLRKYGAYMRSYLQAKHEGSHSLVDLTTETKAQFFPLNHIHKGLQRHLSRGLITETCLSPFMHLSVLWSHPFSAFTDVCSVSLPIVMYLTKPYITINGSQPNQMYFQSPCR